MLLVQENTAVDRCADGRDVTFVTAALDIGRRHGNVSFEEDYIGNVRHLLSLQCPIVLFLQASSSPS
jgi:hypothetical protein